MNTYHLIFMLAGFVPFAGFVPLAGQDTLALETCYQLAVEYAPRAGDREMIREIGQFRRENMQADWLPGLDLAGKASYQSDVVTVAVGDAPFPLDIPEMPHDQYGLNLDVSQNLYDGGRTAGRKRMQEASTAVDIQQVEVDLYGLKERVNQLYFPALLLQAKKRNLAVHLDNLLNRMEVLSTAVAEGTVLESEIKVIEVEALRIRQSIHEIDSRYQAVLGTLKILCGKDAHDTIHLSEPILGTADGPEGHRPEYKWFELKDGSLEARKELISRRRMPVLFAYGQAGYGKPGYNMLSGEWDFYYMIGAGIRWRIWDWNKNRRERQVITRNQQMLRNRKASFDRELESRAQQEEANMERLRESVESDLKVLHLQKEISETAAVKLANGTITATEYIVELNKENLARITLATHRLQLKESVANYMIIQGNF